VIATKPSIFSRNHIRGCNMNDESELRYECFICGREMGRFASEEEKETFEMGGYRHGHAICSDSYFRSPGIVVTREGAFSL